MNPVDENESLIKKLPELTEAEKKELTAMDERGQRLHFQLGQQAMQEEQAKNAVQSTKTEIIANNRAYMDRVANIAKSHGVQFGQQQDGSVIEFDLRKLEFTTRTIN